MKSVKLEKNNRTCEICGKSFYRRGNRTARTCSKKCHALLVSKALTGKPQKRSGTWSNCLSCGKKVYSYPSRKKKYCSLECRNKNLSEWCVSRKGKKNYLWKGGRTKIGGYVYIKVENHPYSHSKSNYFAEHRMVMERKLGRYLDTNEEVHHKNGIKDDNRIENLEIVVKKSHYGNICCPYCNKTFKIK